jgi:hypothetical protein
MSLDSRLREDMRAIADTVEPDVETVLASLLARRDRVRPGRAVLPRVLAAAASLVLAAGLVVWWLGRAHGHENDYVDDPAPPTGTYAARLTGDLAGEWRLRFADDLVSVVAPDRSALGRRSDFGSSVVGGDRLTTSLLDGPCAGEGNYRWSWEQGQLRLEVLDDTCDLRTRILTGADWQPVSGEQFAPGTYRAELTIAQMRRSAVAEGYARTDVDAYLDSEFPGASAVTYTVTAREGTWLVQESIDGAPKDVAWQGRFTVLDRGTVQATATDISCGPIVYDVRPSAGAVSFVVVTDACPTPWTAPVGELIAQTALYESAPFRRLGE